MPETEMNQPDEKEEVDRIRLSERIKKYLPIAQLIACNMEEEREFTDIKAN